MELKFIREYFRSYLHSLPPAFLTFIADFSVKTVNFIKFYSSGLTVANIELGETNALILWQKEETFATIQAVAS
jgi:hypothetical protein